MKLTIHLYTKGIKHAYEYEIDLEPGAEQPVVVSPVSDVNRVFILYPIKPGCIDYHEAPYMYCHLMSVEPTPIRDPGWGPKSFED